MDAATLVFTIVSAFVGCVQTYFSSIPYLGKKDTLKELTNNLREMESLQNSNGEVPLDLSKREDLERHKEFILAMLQGGYIILAGFRRKLIARFAVLFACSIGLSGFIYADLGSSFDVVKGWAEHTEFWDIGIFAFVNAFPYIAAKWIDRLVMPHEWRFVRALLIVEHAYYCVIVEPEMVTFYENVRKYFRPYAYQLKEETNYMLGKPSDLQSPSWLRRKANKSGDPSQLNP